MIIPIESASFVTTNQAAGSADLETVDERIAEDVSLVLQSVKQRKLITNQTAACKEMKKVFPFFKGFSPAVTLTNANEASFYESLFVAGEQRSAYREDMTIAGIESYSKTMPEKRDLEQVVAQVNEFLLPVNRPVLQMDRVLDAVKRESPQVIYTFLMNVLHQLKQQEATKHVHPLVSDLYGDAEFQTALTLAQKNNSSDSAQTVDKLLRWGCCLQFFAL